VKAAFFDHLCLDCIHEWCLNSPDIPLWATFWSKSLGAYWQTYYLMFYSAKEHDAIRSQQSVAERYRRFDETLARMENWLLTRGWRRNRCDHQACMDLACLSSVVRVEAGKKKKK
jgi:hypothetical protein